MRVCTVSDGDTVARAPLWLRIYWALVAVVSAPDVRDRYRFVVPYKVRHTLIDGDLEPCPHCGKAGPVECYSYYEIEEWEQEDIDDDPNDDAFAVVCNVNFGGCGATGGYATSRVEACEKWNRRTY